MKKSIITAALAIALRNHAALADGLPFKGDRFDGPVTELRLTSSQLAQIARGSLADDTRTIALTPQQIARLKSDVGFSPAKIEVWTLEEALTTCSCEMLNFGVPRARDMLQVPHRFLGRDLDDRGNHKASAKSSTRANWLLGAVAALCALAAFGFAARSRRALRRRSSPDVAQRKAAA